MKLFGIITSIAGCLYSAYLIKSGLDFTGLSMMGLSGFLMAYSVFNRPIIILDNTLCKKDIVICITCIKAMREIFNNVLQRKCIYEDSLIEMQEKLNSILKEMERQ